MPAIRELCDVECLQLYSLDSTDIGPEHWLGMARAIRENYEGFDGFVLSHGTDTMAYSAAALSYLIQGSAKPIILTGAQKPIGFDTTDSRVNLLDSFICACSGDMHGVMIVFNGARHSRHPRAQNALQELRRLLVHKLTRTSLTCATGASPNT